MFLILHSPLEQFQVLPLFFISIIDFRLIFTNETFFLCLIFIFSYIIVNSLLEKKTYSLFIFPSTWQTFFEIFYNTVIAIIGDNIKSKTGYQFLPIIFFIFIFCLCLNLIGLIPYSFTLTSHIFVTLYLSLSFFIGINIICILKHQTLFFSLFLPSGTSIFLSLLLVPIEFISFFFKPISLSIRLFANMMAGHTLLKVIVGFTYTLMDKNTILFFLHYIPFLLLLPLLGLEFAVALIQSFVFTIMCSIYLNDSLNLH